MKKVLVAIGILIIVSGSIFWFLVRDKKLDVNSQIVQNLYKKINVSENVSILRYLYENPGTIDNEYKISVGLKGYIEKNGQKDYVPAKDIEPFIKEVFGADIDFKHQTAYLLYDFYCGFRYLENSNEYEFLSGCDGMDVSMYREIVSAEKKGREIIITEKSIYVSHGYGIEGSIDTIYNNINKEKELKILKESEGNYKIKLKDYIDGASTYKYIFEKEGNNYIFKKLELVK